MSPPKGSMAARVPILLNGVLMSNGVPPFDTKKPVDSVSAIINKVTIHKLEKKITRTKYRAHELLLSETHGRPTCLIRDPSETSTCFIGDQHA